MGMSGKNNKKKKKTEKKEELEAIVAKVVRSINMVVTLTIHIPAKGKEPARILPASAQLAKKFAQELGDKGLQKGDEVMVYFPMLPNLTGGMVLHRR